MIEDIRSRLVEQLDTLLNHHKPLPSRYVDPEINAQTSIALLIDHTLLKPEATRTDIDNLCDEAKTYQFASVCINPAYVKLCAERLHDSTVKVCTVIGFPLGATMTETKSFEARQALVDGADELDMVIHIGALKSGDYEWVYRDILTITRLVTTAQKITKVIIETSKLTDEEKVIACLLAQWGGADFVKTSTGFGGGGATIEDVRLMRETVGKTMGVKASGGVRSKEDALAVIEAGASRIGASAGIKIVQGETSQSSY